ncbi:MAG: response regulator [Rhodobacteraceae bacterium]|nr:response regulator [Paracoccaceae bacterium]
MQNEPETVDKNLAADACLRAAIFSLVAAAVALPFVVVDQSGGSFLPEFIDSSLHILVINGFFFALAFMFLQRQFRKMNFGVGPSAQIWDVQAEIEQTDNLLENLPVALLRLNDRGLIDFANRSARKLLGREDLKALDFSDIVEGLGRSMRDRLRAVAYGNATRATEMGRSVRNGEEIFLQVSLMKMAYVAGDCCIVVLNDRTDLKMLEEQFAQSQKMEAVGQLAGGIAHDFNNILTAINGHSDLLLLRHKSGDPEYGDLIQIRQNSIRAAALVRQLLAFSRKQTLRPKVVNLVETMSELTQLLNRLLGEKVILKIEDSPGLDSVRIDEQQFEQVIMNLVVNARDSMPDGGTVAISTCNLTLKEPMERDRAIIPSGDYVLVKVRDDGCGIDPDVLPKIFEPFYTTKRVGEGTGLGLSTVYGIIKQTGGFVFVTSEVGKGTLFDIYLPSHNQADGQPEERSFKDLGLAPSNGQGRILLVEDEVAVRSFAVRALKLKGYVVDEAECGDQALEVIAAATEPYDVYISDVIMPGMDGPTWVRRALETHPDTKVIFISGYAEDAFGEGKREIDGSAFLPKPFSLNDLVSKVSEVLSEMN